METSPYVFRPITDSPDIVLRNSVTSPVRQTKLYGCWRNNPEIRSNSRHSTTSRPGSSATNSRPPSSNIYYPICSSHNNSSSTLYCKSSNNSLTDVIVSRNFQQLSVSNRRAAFKGFEIQKGSSFDGKRRRPQNSLDSENTGSSLDLKSEDRSVVSPVEVAKRELNELLRIQREGGGNSVQKSTSLPSFPESFNGFLGKSSERNIDEQLDEEIKMIVAKAERCKEVEEELELELPQRVQRHQTPKQDSHRPKDTSKMHLEALMQLPYLNDAVPPGDQNASISPLCSPHIIETSQHPSSKFQFPAMHPKEEEWSQDFIQYFPPSSNMDTLPSQLIIANAPSTTNGSTHSHHNHHHSSNSSSMQQQQIHHAQQQHIPLQRSQPQEIMNTFDEAFFNAFTDGLQSNFDQYPLDSFPSPPRSGYSSPAIAINPTSTSSNGNDYIHSSSSFDPYFLPVPEDPQEPQESAYEYYPLTKSDPHMGRMMSDHPPEILEEMTDSLGSQLPGSPDSTIKEELLEPIASQEDSGVYTCYWIDCGEEFENQERLVDHVNGIHMETKKGCEELPCLWKDCPRQLKPFNAKYKLLTHMRVHTREKPYKCNFENCDRAFARLENKKIHFRSHTGQKPFNCKYSKEFNCTKKFSNSSDRAKHEQTHKDPKPYRCEVVGCCKRYTDPSSLRKHVKSHSQEEQVQYRKAKDLANAAKRTASPSNKSMGGVILPSQSPISWNTPTSGSSLPTESIFMDSKVFQQQQQQSMNQQASSPSSEMIFPKFTSEMNPSTLNNTTPESILSSDAIMYTTTTSVAQNIRRQDSMMEEDIKCHSFDPLSFRYDNQVDCGSYDLHSQNWCS
ncbi:uncharacterized protein [Lepeophtheirus salmonis]|uniref:uncharacterized protein isoform X2 n=1 Tax=Lepeophtheirus salmonis TaxID=72036 RepID=UPI001AE95192|nr:transcriptional activator GLI3-like isoform X2 [Lepeophtheirus salmonis]